MKKALITLAAISVATSILTGCNGLKEGKSYTVYMGARIFANKEEQENFAKLAKVNEQDALNYARITESYTFVMPSGVKLLKKYENTCKVNARVSIDGEPRVNREVTSDYLEGYIYCTSLRKD